MWTYQQASEEIVTPSASELTSWTFYSSVKASIQLERGQGQPLREAVDDYLGEKEMN